MARRPAIRLCMPSEAFCPACCPCTSRRVSTECRKTARTLRALDANFRLHRDLWPPTHRKLALGRHPLCARSGDVAVDMKFPERTRRFLMQALQIDATDSMPFETHQ